jgi:hypothetical protein
MEVKMRKARGKVSDIIVIRLQRGEDVIQKHQTSLFGLWSKERGCYQHDWQF